MKKIILFMLISFMGVQASATTVVLGVFGGADSRDEADNGSVYGLSAEFLWGGKDFKMGFGAHKALQEINGVSGGYETLSLNFRYGGFYVNPFYGQRAIKASDLFDSDNLYPTQGVVFGYDFLVSKSFSIGLMGIYEDPGELDSDKANVDYVELESTVSPALALKFWWW